MPSPMLLVEAEIKPDSDGERDELDHIFCCRNENVGLCGLDLAGLPKVPEDDDTVNLCRVCNHLCDEDFCPLDHVCPPM